MVSGRRGALARARAAADATPESDGARLESGRVAAVAACSLVASRGSPPSAPAKGAGKGREPPAGIRAPPEPSSSVDGPVMAEEPRSRESVGLLVPLVTVGVAAATVFLPTGIVLEGRAVAARRGADSGEGAVRRRKIRCIQCS